MNLLTTAWIPVCAAHGAGPFRLLTYEELLCGPGDWALSLPRDDLELAGLELLVCLTQVLFLPTSDPMLRQRIAQPLTPELFADGLALVRDWFDLDHPTQPFMQTRGVQAKEITPIQKLLIGLPEGNNHAFFNDVGEVKRIGGTVAAIALFNQAANCPSFGGGFKGSLRGGAPVTTLVAGNDLRETVWRNVLTLQRVQERLPDYEPDWTRDRPTWIAPIREKDDIHWSTIGLARGLFWQPTHVELVKAKQDAPCEMIGGAPGEVYGGFRKEKFNFTVEGVWPHPHGALTSGIKKGVLEQKFVSFTTTAPAWTHLTELVVPRALSGPDVAEGCVPAGPVTQANIMSRGKHQALHLLVGGYRTKQASVLERRHELISLASGWQDEEKRLVELVELGKAAKKILRGKLYFARQGYKDRKMEGIGVAIHETGEKLYYARTERLFHQTMDNEATSQQWQSAKIAFSQEIASICQDIFKELTDPYTYKPELVPIIAWARRGLDRELVENLGS